ncbi:MAG TPA: AI-2E family transporter, partial [Candidatus Berkiella sp.]|nr:AI-2E family transporter [Candidatus Berkiella sp.]
TIVLVVLLFLVPALQHQIVALMANLPGMIDVIQQSLIPQLESFGIKPEDISLNALKDAVKSHATQATQVAKWIWKTLFESSLAMIHILMNILIVLVASFYLLRDWRQILKSCQRILPKKLAPTIV